MSKDRQRYTAAEKIAALRRHHLDKVPVSALCTELGVAPSIFYRWQKDLFEGGAQVWAAGAPGARRTRPRGQPALNPGPAT